MIEIFVQRFVELILAPLSNPDMLWVAIPLLTSMTVVEIYFGRYKGEQLGWNTALSNSIVLTFVGIDLMRMHYYRGDFLTWTIDFSVSLGVLLWGLLLLFINFFHKLPERMAFIVSNFIPVNMIAYIVLVLIYTEIPMDFTTIVSGTGLILTVWLLFELIHLIEPKATGA